MTPKQMQQAAAKVARSYILGGDREVDGSRDATAELIAAAIEAIVIEEVGEEPQGCSYWTSEREKMFIGLIEALDRAGISAGHAYVPDSNGGGMVIRMAMSNRVIASNLVALAAIQGGEG